MKSKNFFRSISSLLLFFILAVHFSAIAQDDAKEIEARRAALRLLLTAELRQTFDMITDSTAMAIWEAKFWKTQDPTPTTPENEFYESFQKRYAHAHTIYSNLVPPLYLDDRGKYYIKYGEPDDFAQSIGIGQGYLSNVTWAYYKYNLFIDFVEKEFFGYEEAADLTEAVRAAPINQKARMAMTLYGERENLHQRYHRFRDLQNHLDAVNQVFIQTAALQEDKNIALSTAPPADYHHDYKADPLSAQMKAANFRGENSKTRVEVYYSIPLQEVTFSAGRNYPFESFVDKRISVIDNDGYQIINNEERLQLAVANLDQTQGRLYMNQHDEVLQPGLYQVAMRLENDASNRLAILKAQLMVKDFTGDGLHLSDLQLASQVREGVVNRRSKANDILVVPYISEIVRKDSPLYVYFEVYNLSTRNERSQYNVKYTITALQESRSILSQSAAKIVSFLVGGDKITSVASSFDGSGASEFQQVYLSLDFTNAPSGKVELLIEVFDQNNGQNASSQMVMTLK